jgi:hypothetical protein
MRTGCPSIAYTYTEPFAFFEYTLDTSVREREAGLRNVLVTAGYVNEPPLRELARVTDAANIDLKFMNDRLYREVCDGALAPILKAIELTKSLGVWVEITNLSFPTIDNDRDEDHARRSPAGCSKTSARTLPCITPVFIRNIGCAIFRRPPRNVAACTEIGPGGGAPLLVRRQRYDRKWRVYLCPACHSRCCARPLRDYRTPSRRHRLRLVREPIAGVWK